MSFDTKPEIGSWYRRIDRTQAFRVVAFDSEAATVDIEYFDGTVDEWPLSHWRALEIETCDEPQDWSGPFDSVEREETDAGDTDIGARDWKESVAGPDLETDGLDSPPGGLPSEPATRKRATRPQKKRR